MAQLLFIIAVALCVPARGAEKVHLVVLHTNDLHGRFEPVLNRHDRAWGTGGLARAATVVEEARRAAPSPDHVLLLDGGDMFHGVPETDASRGRALLTVLEAMGYHAVCPGNHDFAYGAKRLAELAAAHPIPLVACNLRRKKTALPPPYIHPRLVRTVAGVRVGITGFITPSTAWFNLPDHVAGLDFLSARRVLAETVARLRRESDVVIILSHAGLSADKSMAFKYPGVDVILGGHSHSVVNPAMMKGGVLVCQAGAHATHIGRVDLVFDRSERKIVSKKGKVIRLDAKVAQHPAIAKLAASLHDPRYDEVVGSSDLAFTRRSLGGSSLGRLVTDAVLEATGAAMVLLNNSSIRSALHPGPLTARDCYMAAPYSEPLVAYAMTGRAFRTVLERAVWNGHPTLQVAGVTFYYNLDRPKGRRVERILLRGTLLSDDATYRVVTSWYLARRGGAFEDLFTGGADVGRTANGCLTDIVRRRRRLTTHAPKRMHMVRFLPLMAGERIDVNRAPARELVRLPGVGPDLASRIVEARRRGPAFAGPADLLRVKGVGPKLLEKIRPHITFGSKTKGETR